MTYRSVGSFYQQAPAQTFSGLGCGCGLGADFAFNGTKAYADHLDCDRVSKASGYKVFPPSCDVYNTIRAAMSQLGLGMGMGQGASWGAADQAAMRQVCAHLGIGGWGCDKGWPAKDNLLALETAVQKKMVIGDEPIPELERDPQSGQYLTTGTKGELTGAHMLAIGAGALVLLGALALASKGRRRRRAEKKA
jgi:hypothetical protein